MILFVCLGGWFGFLLSLLGFFSHRYAGQPHFYSILYSKPQICGKIFLICVFQKRLYPAVIIFHGRVIIFSIHWKDLMCQGYLFRDNSQGVLLECELRFGLLLSVSGWRDFCGCWGLEPLGQSRGGRCWELLLDVCIAGV